MTEPSLESQEKCVCGHDRAEHGQFKIREHLRAKLGEFGTVCDGLCGTCNDGGCPCDGVFKPAPAVGEGPCRCPEAPCRECCVHNQPENKNRSLRANELEAYSRGYAQGQAASREEAKSETKREKIENLEQELSGMTEKAFLDHAEFQHVVAERDRMREALKGLFDAVEEEFDWPEGMKVPAAMGEAKYLLAPPQEGWKCPTCDGSGWHPQVNEGSGNAHVHCRQCQGSGKVEP